MSSDESVEEAFSHLQIADETFLSPDTESTASTNSDDPKAGENEARQNLNEFLISCNIAPVVRQWLTWSDSSQTTRQRYTKKSAEIVAAVLKILTPDITTAGHLWESLITTPDMSKILGIQASHPSEKHYLEALAEAYKNAEG